MPTLVPANYPPEYEVEGTYKKFPKHEFSNKSKIILAADLRRFTETMTDLKGKSRFMGRFLSKFFDKSAEVIHDLGGFMNKYLGDGFLAHFDFEDAGCRENAANTVVRGMLNIHAIFEQEKRAFNFKLLGLSTVLSIDHHLMMGRIGSTTYTDFSMIGPGVNSIFRVNGRN